MIIMINNSRVLRGGEARLHDDDDDYDDDHCLFLRLMKAARHIEHFEEDEF